MNNDTETVTLTGRLLARLERRRIERRWRATNDATQAEGCPCGNPATEVQYDDWNRGRVPVETWWCARHVGVDHWMDDMPADEAWAWILAGKPEEWRPGRTPTPPGAVMRCGRCGREFAEGAEVDPLAALVRHSRGDHPEDWRGR